MSLDFVNVGGSRVRKIVILLLKSEKVSKRKMGWGKLRRGRHLYWPGKRYDEKRRRINEKRNILGASLDIFLNLVIFISFSDNYV